ncbi:hypothetical protein OQE50_23600 (plasmid) [Enterobacter kobei]|uniref:hypothetical protein n=1 Tax=Enterobacter kobei TaxID=208224 RepID=UPI00224B3CE1|nr:hypothetical protein [Enterobacter kobei]UZQ70200.1 hypothetical protein OQE50_23600 [Enterobacter kobei]
MHRYFPQFMASYPSGLSHFTLETNKKRHSRQYDFNSHVAGRSASLHESGRVLSSRAGRRQHHQDNVLPHPILHKSEFDFSSKVVKSERRRVRLLRIINNASVGREITLRIIALVLEE